MAKIPLAIYATSTIIVSVIFLQGCAAPLIAAGAASLTGYHQMAGNDGDPSQPNDQSQTCDSIRLEISAIDRTIQSYNSQQTSNTVQPYLTTANTQLATQAATGIASHAAPGALSYIQPLMATTQGIFNNFQSQETGDDVNKAQARKDQLITQYNQHCSVMSRYKAKTKEVQTLLNEIGYPCGAADGIAGEQTKEAIRRFQMDRGLPADGAVSTELLTLLRQEQ